MKKPALTKLLVATLALTLTVTGCRTKRPDKNITPIPGVNVGDIDPDGNRGLMNDNSDTLGTDGNSNNRTTGSGTDNGLGANGTDRTVMSGIPVPTPSPMPLPAPVPPPTFSSEGVGQGDNIDPETNMTRDEGAFAANTIHFDYDSSVVRSAEIVKLDEVIQILLTDGSLKLIVEGHCDSRGTEEYNRALGERRANSIREHLINAGIGPERARTITYGEDKPKDFGQDEAAWAANRRGEFVLLRPRN